MAKRPGEYLEFIDLFNEGRYYEALEVLQDLWQINRSNHFYKGLIQAAGAYNHWQDNSFYWAESLFRSSAELLKKYGPVHQGLDVDHVTAVLGRCAEVAGRKRQDPQGDHPLPELRLVLTD